MKKMMMALAVSALVFGAVTTAGTVYAQDAAAPANGQVVTQDGQAAQNEAT